MDRRRLLSGAVAVAVVGGVLALLVGQLLGQPVLFGFVTTGSMAPTLEAGDGFVAVPQQVAGPVEEGDVVVFEAETVQGGGLTTHRVVGETEAGYVTKGDANPFTDQDGGEPPVTKDRIVAHALQVNGEVVAIPHLGTVATTLRDGLAAPFAALGEERAGTVLVFVGVVLFIAAGALGEGRRTERSTSRENVVAVWSIVLFVALALAVAATVAMVGPSGTYHVEVVATETPSDDPQVVAPGETATASYEVHNAGVVPSLVVSEPLDPGATATPERAVLGFDDRAEVTVRATPEATGEYTYRVRESRYLLVLPSRLLVALHSLHPWLAVLAVDAALALVVVAGAFAVFGTGYLRMRPGPDVPLRVRIERKVRRWLER